MKKRTSFFKFTQLWIIIALITAGSIIIILDITISYRDFHIQTKQLRDDYITQQKEMVKQEVNRVVARINHKKTQIEVVTKEKIKSRTYEAYAIAQHIYQQNEATKSKAEITQMILDALRPIRFAEDSGYYFAVSLDGVQILFADKPEMEGLNLLDVQDTHGKYFVRETIETAIQHGEGFQEYYWTKPGVEGKNFKKISFVKQFKPLNWFIGTGLYVDDIEAQIKNDVLSAISRIRYGKEGYIFVNRLNGDALVSNGKRFDGTRKLWQVFNKKPEKQRAVFKKEYDAALKPEGDYIYYSWVKLSNPDHESPKTSYIYGLPDLQWLVGAGVYLDDVETDIAVMYTQLNNQIKTKMFFFTLIVIGIISFVLFFINRLNYKLKNDFDLFISFFNRAANSDEAINRDLVQITELDTLAENANKMLLDKINAQQALLNKKDALRQSEAKYRALAEEAPDLRYQIDVEEKITFVSHSVYRLTGYTAKEIIGKNILEMYAAPGDRNPLLAAMQKDGSVENFVVQLKRKDDSLWWGSLNAQFYKDQTGSILGIDGVIRNVTEQKLAQNLLKESEQRLQLAIEGANLGLWDWNMQTNDVYFSPGYFSILGYGPTELPHTLTTWENLLHPDDRQSAKRQILAYVDKGSGNWIAEYRLRAKDGRYLWISWRGKVVEFSQDGSPIRAAGTHRDITNRKISEQEIIRSKEEWEKTFDAIPDIITIQDKNMQIVRANKTATDFFALTFGEIIGQKCYEVFCGTQKPCPGCPGIITLNDINSHVEIIEHKSLGKTFQVSSSPLLDDNCEVQYLIHSARDITEKKKMEKELFKAHKLESVGTLAGGIAHDFNNFLATILGNISFALTTVDPKDEIYEVLTDVEEASLRAKDLTQQLLTFSKGGGPIKKISSIDEIIRDSANFVLRGSNIKCDFNFSEELWPVAIDMGQISQVIRNIVINASQAMPAGGTITIDGSNYCLDSSDIIPISPGNYIKIVVKDQGIGIPAEMLDKIFDPYFTTKQKSSGLGLAITHSIIKKHDGYITVDSEPDRGTTFTIHLPASQERPELELENAIVPQAATHSKIMIMDDEEMIRNLIKRLLTRKGYEVVSAKDGDEAVLLYQKAKEAGEPIDLIIMDLTIPGGMGGKDAVEKIHKIDPSTKVIVSSGYSNDPVMANFSEYGFCAAIVKPFQMRVLTELVNRALSS